MLSLLGRLAHRHVTPEQIGFDTTQGRPDLVNQAAECLRKNGIVILKNAFSPETCSQVLNEWLEFSKEIETLDDEVIEKDRYLFRGSSGGPTSYPERAKYPKAIVNKRFSEKDKGMIDVFNVDRLLTTVSPLKTELSSGMIFQIVNLASPIPMESRNTNLYYNRSVQETRGLHFDSLADSYKCFVYLTNVYDLNDGPYCYVPSSNSSPVLRMNYVYNKIFQKGDRETEASFFDDNQALPILGDAGTAVISAQNGVHRGYPQGPDGSRTVLVQRYEEKGK